MGTRRLQREASEARVATRSSISALTTWVRVTVMMRALGPRKRRPRRQPQLWLLWAPVWTVLIPVTLRTVRPAAIQVSRCVRLQDRSRFSTSVIGKLLHRVALQSLFNLSDRCFWVLWWLESWLRWWAERTTREDKWQIKGRWQWIQKDFQWTQKGKLEQS